MCCGLLGWWLTGCAVLDFDPASSRVVSADTHGSVLLIKDLYEFAEAAERRNKAGDAWQYGGTKEELDACQKPPETLRQALQLSLAEPDSSDGGRARQLLETCLVQTREPLLKGFIQQELSHLQRLEESRAATRKLQRALTSKRRESNTLQNRLKTIKSKRQDTRETVATAAQAKEAEVQIKQAEVQSKEAEIQTLEARVATLEAKLQSLTSIEQKMNQEEQKQTP